MEGLSWKFLEARSKLEQHQVVRKAIDDGRKYCRETCRWLLVGGIEEQGLLDCFGRSE